MGRIEGTMVIMLTKAQNIQSLTISSPPRKAYALKKEAQTVHEQYI
jgi:hypothetical protein